MISEFLKRYSPPGMELKQEKKLFIWGMFLSILYSIFYWSAKYIEAAVIDSYDRLIVFQSFARSQLYRFCNFVCNYVWLYSLSLHLLPTRKHVNLSDEENT